MSQWIARLTRIHVIIIIVSVATFLTTFIYLQSLDEKISVAVLANNVNAGETVSEEDLNYIEVSKDDKFKDFFFLSNELENKTVIAKVDLYRDEFLNKSNTIRSIDFKGLQSMSIGVELNNANGGNIRRGDIVDIWQTGENSKLIASQVNIRNAIEPDKRLGVATSQSLTLVLAVKPKQASALSKIVNSRDIMVVLSNGVQPASTANRFDETSKYGFESIELDPVQGE